MTADFNRMLDILMPSERGIVTMLEAYFDESQRKDGVFCVAGYAFTKVQAKAFNRQWRALFPAGCHMRELTARQCRFKGITKTQSENYIKGAVQIIRRRAAFGVVASCSLPEVEGLLPRFVVNGRGYVIDGMQNAYPILCHLVMALMGKLTKESGQTIAYFFESGHKFAPAAHRFMSLTDGSKELKEFYRHHSHAFVTKADATPLQAADILAWEWAKFMDESVMLKKRPMRQSLKVLLAPDGKVDARRFTGRHITGHTLETFMRKSAQLGFLQVMEERARVQPK